MSRALLRRASCSGHCGKGRDRMRWRLLAGALAGLVLLTGGCSPSETATPPASQPPPPRFLLQQNLAGDRGPLLVTVDQEVYPPHSAGLWHSHPGPGSFCVLQGRLTVQVRDANGSVLATLGTYSNLNRTGNGYVQKTFNLSTYIGQRVQI